MSKRLMAHPDDLLLVGYMFERQAYPEFLSRQVITSTQQSAMQGRRFRRLYVTDMALPTMTRSLMEDLYSSSVKQRPGYGEIVSATAFRPYVPPTKLELLAKRVKGWVL